MRAVIDLMENEAIDSAMKENTSNPAKLDAEMRDNSDSMEVLTTLLNSVNTQISRLDKFDSVETPMRYLDDSMSEHSIPSLTTAAAHIIR